MPGRRSTTVPSVGKTRPPKQKGKRSLNALSIAEQQHPERTKIRRSRLGQAEKESLKRKRQDEGEDAILDESPEQMKRRKAGNQDRYGNEIEVGSDSSGNEWVVGQVEDGDDSDLDSDEAMGVSDEERFEGFSFRESSAIEFRSRPGTKVSGTDDRDSDQYEIDLRENGNESGFSGEENDGLGDGAVDLAAMLDESEDASEYSEFQSQGSEDPGGSRDGGVGPDDDSDITDDEDSEEGKRSMLSYSGDEDEPEGSAKFAALQALVSTMNKEDQDAMKNRVPTDAQESMTPSDFGTNPKRKFTAADLLNSTTEPGIRRSQKLLAQNDAVSFSKRAGIAKALDAPLPKRQQDRLDRAAAYEQSKETLKRWIDTVKHNRRAEHLSFPVKDPNTVAAQGTHRLLPNSHSKPFTELEGTIQNLLQESELANPNGGSEEDKLQAFEELRTNKMPLKEVLARRAELRKARELLFREEVRAKRIKKIKSKSYRKVHRKEKERTAQQEKDALTAAGVDDSESEQERKDRCRAEERMGARHRESRWIKGVKDSGRAKWDEDARGGMTETARRGEELRRRIEGKQVAADEDGLISSESDGEEDMDDVEHIARDRLQRLFPKADEADADAHGSKLASMDFMKKAEAARRARNDADAESLRRDLAGEETPSDEETSEGPGRRLFGPSKSKPPPSQIPSREQKSEFEERQDSGDEDDRERYGAEGVEIIADTSSANGGRVPVEKPSLRNGKKIADLRSSGEQSLVARENPWLTSTKKDSYSSKRQAKDTDRGAIISNTVALADAPLVMMAKPRSALKGARDAEKAGQNAELPRAAAAAVMSDGDDQDDDTQELPFVFRNQDLVRKAFAGDEVVADFDKEKHQTVEDEQEKIIDNTLPGWGTWTGAGISKKQEKRNKGKVLVKEPGIAKEKRQDAKLDRVIINEKRVKKNAKYLASNLPHPFETKQQYERSLRLPVGPEWTTKETFQSATKPRVLMKQGVIAPMVKPMI
ncbi:hypothetical protein N7G274_006380 [Stereocaulon virgatum]|uniref:Utp14-domain-containing protein n=1 Tax=Stereocaulon virgatum TaxID=373712 RepID=A0ABR4A934_9LECA